MRILLTIAAMLLAAVPPLAVGETLGDVTIENTTFQLTYELRMEPGSTLTIRNASVQLAGGRIVVDAGATMVVDRASIVQLSGHAQGDVSLQGTLRMNNGTLSGTKGIDSFAGRITVEDSAFTGNTLAIFAYRTAVVEVKRSAFTDNSAGGAQVRDGTLRVSDSTFTNNDGQYGSVGFISTVAGASVFGEANGWVLRSTITGADKGIQMQGADIDKVEVADNCLKQNVHAIQVQGESNPNVHDNAILDNTGYGYYNSGTTAGTGAWTGDARNNWWGTAAGPSSSGPNAAGGAAGVVLLTSPWLTASPVAC